ncbi:GNAT family N-acetyltransferase [Streptomyces sp. NPDC127084]|uniref:GNAT family N-acetyltransferase n=1 Tax=Streptomyces sp. NPDC127084 TaxID=3347133 RepID=UPI003660CA98
MTTATLPPAPLAVLPPRAPAARWHRASEFSVRPAHEGDGAALAALSWQFVHTGALRERSLSLYLSRASDFLVAQTPDGTLEGCLGLSEHPTAGVLYNFCVAAHRQGSGMGGRLLHAAFARARSLSLPKLFTATTGSGRLFLRHGFVPVCPSLAPAAWSQSLDPGRNARVLARTL